MEALETVRVVLPQVTAGSHVQLREREGRGGEYQRRRGNPLTMFADTRPCLLAEALHRAHESAPGQNTVLEGEPQQVHGD